ncbi:MAG: CoA-binding protein [DPANN group archaeon]|nr:CoA-binding protein [DPANN group archaeon]
MNIAIIGASAKQERMSNKAVRAYRDQGHRVFPVNPKEQEIEGIPCHASIQDIREPIDRVSVYVNPEIGMTLAEGIAAKRPRELFLNPGSESETLIAKFRELGLEPVMKCSILDIGIHPEEMK